MFIVWRRRNSKSVMTSIELHRLAVDTAIEILWLPFLFFRWGGYRSQCSAVRIPSVAQCNWKHHDSTCFFFHFIRIHRIDAPRKSLPAMLIISTWYPVPTLLLYAPMYWVKHYEALVLSCLLSLFQFARKALVCWVKYQCCAVSWACVSWSESLSISRHRPSGSWFFSFRVLIALSLFIVNYIMGFNCFAIVLCWLFLGICLFYY